MSIQVESVDTSGGASLLAILLVSSEDWVWSTNELATASAFYFKIFCHVNELRVSIDLN